ncbi:UvrD/REP helicase N-terminal domain-containing protein [Nocardia amikacinitolerans]|nr:UvrD/REP helicase N-terminal domain-containing protein [Nocardia amikacinitolerans]
MVHAPPGSGKTKLLATRVAFDFVNRIPKPHGAACVTLTNASADELRRRIEAIVAPRRSTFFVGTVHSFAYRRILLPFADIAGKSELRHYSIATKAQEKAAMSAAIARTPGAHAEKYIDSTIKILRNRFATDEQWASAGEAVRQVAQRYRKLLAESNLLDFTGMIEQAVSIVEKNLIVRRVLNSKYPHLYVDEYQDLAPGLDKLVQALCFDYYNGAELFAVGDPDQAVYGFSGARPELLHELSQRSGVTPIRLKTNYRSGDEILRIAQFMKHSDFPTVGRRVGGSVSGLPFAQVGRVAKAFEPLTTLSNFETVAYL